MKPYKIIKSKVNLIKKNKLVLPLASKKIPLTFFKNVFTPKKKEILVNALATS